MYTNKIFKNHTIANQNLVKPIKNKRDFFHHTLQHILYYNFTYPHLNFMFITIFIYSHICGRDSLVAKICFKHAL